jgi:5-(aminomethyl)-3-furanmethanol phosphate kinase
MRPADVPTNGDAHGSSLSLSRPERRREGGREQGRTPLTVVKLGGSHAHEPELRAWLGAIARARGSVVLVPGGGPFADAVRVAQARMGFDDRAAHAMAMMAMAQFGRALISLEPAIQLATSRAAIRTALRARLIPAWAPERMAGVARLPETWDLTSDSLAAWLTGTIGAARLVLVKHGRFEGPTLDAAELAASGVVDPLFPCSLSRSGARAFIAPSDAAERFAGELRDLPFPEIVTKGRSETCA